jgi:hypothetical protein
MYLFQLEQLFEYSTYLNHTSILEAIGSNKKLLMMSNTYHRGIQPDLLIHIDYVRRRTETRMDNNGGDHLW